MNPEKGYYSLVQFCPSAARAEAVNVGVALLCAEKHFVEVRLSSNSQRAARFFGRGSFDAKVLQLAKTALANRIQIEREQLLAVENWRKFINSLGNDIQLTQPRPIKVRNPGVLLEHLFCELVEPIPSENLDAKTMVPALDKAFHSALFEGRIDFDQNVVIPILEIEQTFPYVYHNGQTNLVLPKSFSTQPRRAKRTASELAVQGQFLKKNPDNEVQRNLIVVSSSTESIQNQGVEVEVQRVLNALGVDFVPNASINEFISRVDKEAH